MCSVTPPDSETMKANETSSGDFTLSQSSGTGEWSFSIGTLTAPTPPDTEPAPGGARRGKRKDRQVPRRRTPD